MVFLRENVEHDLRHRAAGTNVHIGFSRIQDEHGLHLGPEGIVLHQHVAQIAAGGLAVRIPAGREQWSESGCARAVSHHAQEVTALGGPVLYACGGRPTGLLWTDIEQILWIQHKSPD
ncbi:hypothetical protein D3C78_1523300 [compost metagenome]